jgi:hypothetical protein
MVLETDFVRPGPTSKGNYEMRVPFQPETGDKLVPGFDTYSYRTEEDICVNGWVRLTSLL